MWKNTPGSDPHSVCTGEQVYILDLQPDKSVIKKLLDEGFDVYVIDWGYPSGTDRISHT